MKCMHPENLKFMQSYVCRNREMLEHGNLRKTTAVQLVQHLSFQTIQRNDAETRH